LTGSGIEELHSSFIPGETIAFTGPSGVGKSALTNRLAGIYLQKTGSQREDDKKGRHTTTYKEIFTLPGGVLVIDTPGLRELQFWGDEAGLNETFSDIYEIAQHCRFNDCTHTGEPGCAVQKAVEEGSIDPLRLQNYLNLQAELLSLERRTTEKGRLEKKQMDKQLAKSIKQLYKIKEK
jgi:ribosome biogenesis GTPase